MSLRATTSGFLFATKTGLAMARLIFALAIVFLGVAHSASAATYDFLNVTATGTTTSQFTSQNGNGVINVSQTFSTGGAGSANNNNAAIFPSQFNALFPGSGQVQGHLAQTVYNHTSVVTFDLTGYNLSSTTVFGMWNTTDEVTAPVDPGGGSTPVYQVQLIDAGNNQVNPTTFNLIGNQDNETQVAARSQMLMNTATGEITAGTVINASGTHTNAAFWDNIPIGTKEIRVYADLPALNNVGDGVGYYFAEIVPEPGTGGLVLASATVMLLRRRKTG